VYARELVSRGAAKVYGAARDPAAVTEPGVTPLALDITDPERVAQVAAQCTNVNLLVNNAGVLKYSTFTGAPNLTGGSSSPSGASSSGSAGSQPAAIRVGRGGPTGRTFLLIRPRSRSVPVTSPPTGRNPARLAAAPRSGSATYPSPIDASVTLAPLPPSGATGAAAIGVKGSCDRLCRPRGSDSLRRFSAAAGEGGRGKLPVHGAE
jgi:hypothetical protein